MSDFNEQTTPTARKAHTCFACGDKIDIGEKYLRNTGCYEGDFYSSAEHSTCSRVYGLLDMYGEGVHERYALEFAYEVARHFKLGREENERARDFVKRMVALDESARAKPAGN